MRWKLDEEDASLLKAVLDADTARLSTALTAEATTRWQQLAAAVIRYRDHPYRRTVEEPAILAETDLFRLLDYAPERAGATRTTLFVPSLINRYYILDLTERTSLLRHLARRGHQPLVIDWKEPSRSRSRKLGLDDYVAGALDEALTMAMSAGGSSPALVGYCMGGTLSVALAARRREDVAGLALLAAPWDFHAPDRPHAEGLARAMAAIEPMVDAMGSLPVDAIQSLFAALDPLLTVRKFLRFAKMRRGSAAEKSFVALEDWVNDGAPLAAPVSRQAFGQWYGDNLTMRGRWEIAGDVVDPAAIRRPTLVVAPDRDRIVPPESALGILDRIEGAQAMRIPGGHIGMVTGRAARGNLWKALDEWLRHLG